MNIAAVETYIEDATDIINSSPQLDEANTKAAILRDFLEILGWEIPTNTQLEYSVEAFGRTYKVDYALVLEGTPVAFIEAKGTDTRLNPDHDEQLSSYMTNENVNYGILTNGEQYRFFQRSVDAENVDVQVIADVQLKELPNHLPVLRAYQKGKIESGASAKILRRINQLQRARETLRADKERLSTKLSELLSEQVSDSIQPFAETQSKEMIDRLIEDINEEIDIDDSDSDGSTPNPDDGEGPLEPIKNHTAGTISRSELTGDRDMKVAVFPTQESGLTFLKENNAWGFVRVGSEFEYVAMYLTSGVREVRYVARVKDTVSPNEADLERPPLAYVNREEIADTKKVVRFEPNSLYELEDPVPYESAYPQSLQYTTLGKLRTAETTDDML
jgi:predicted type IV restriction endonuclease